MKKAVLRIAFAVFALTLSATAQAEIFFGNGRCGIESLPCVDGQSIACSASGGNGGYCVAEKEGKYLTLICHANGSAYSNSSTTSRRCQFKRGWFGR